jgi:hypothetical protein
MELPVRRHRTTLIRDQEYQESLKDVEGSSEPAAEPATRDWRSDRSIPLKDDAESTR